MILQAKTVVAPLDRIKILFQASNPDFRKYVGRAGFFIGFFRTRSLLWKDLGVELFVPLAIFTPMREFAVYSKDIPQPYSAYFPMLV